jgi:hypothetical protein
MDEPVQPRLFTERQHDDGRHSAGEHELAAPGQNAQSHDDERSAFGRTIEIGPRAPDGNDIGGDNEGTHDRDQCSRRLLSIRHDQAGDSSEDANEKEGPKAPESRSRTARVARPLSLEPDRQADQPGDDEMGRGGNTRHLIHGQLVRGTDERRGRRPSGGTSASIGRRI